MIDLIKDEGDFLLDKLATLLTKCCKTLLYQVLGKNL